MDQWSLEIMAELHRKRLVQSMDEIRLEQEAERANPFHPGRFARTMVFVSLWMIAFGEQLHKRYAGPWSEARATQPRLSTEAR